MLNLLRYKNVRKLNKLSFDFLRGKKFCEGLSEVKNILEFKNGISCIQEGKFEQAEMHLKECLKIFKNIGQTNTLSYLFVLKKYTQALFYSKKIKECESALNASIDLSKIFFKDYPELIFPSYRNLIAFYTYTDIQKGSELIDSLINSSEEELNKHKKYFYYAGGAVKLLNNEYSLAKTYINYAISLPDLPADYQGFNLHNLAMLHSEMIRDYEILDEEKQIKWLKENNLSDIISLRKESFLLLKQALYRLEFGNTLIERDSTEKISLNKFLHSQMEIPESEQEEQIISNSFRNPESGLTLTNIAEIFFEQGKDKDRQTAYWLKTGIKHYESYEKENISRHLIIFALFYSQLGQSMFAEGLYRKSIELLKNVKVY